MVVVIFTIKKSSDLIDNQIHDLSACNMVKVTSV
jgi:hypothetical protein